MRRCGGRRRAPLVGDAGVAGAVAGVLLAVLAAPSNPCPKRSKVQMVLGDAEGHLGDRNALLCIAPCGAKGPVPQED